MMWTDVWAVVRREYLQRVRSKWFIAATVGAPVLLAAVFVVPNWLAARGQEQDRTIAIVDGTNVLYERLAPDLEAGGWTVSEQRWHAEVVTELRERAADDELGGFMLLDELTLESGEAVLYTNARLSTLRRVALRSAIARAALEFQLEQRGVDAEAMLAGGELRVEMLSGSGADVAEAEFAAAYIGTFFLYMVILLYAVSVMRATLEEKTSRVVEVIISSMKPWHLMLGKILGVGAVGLTQIAVWLAAGVLLVVTGLPMLVAARPEMATLAEVADLLPGLGLLALFIGFFVFGFFMYAALYAAVGAMCNTDEEAQQAQLPVMFFLVVPVLLAMDSIENPSTPLSTWTSLFPLFTPILMWARIAGGSVPAWQIVLSFFSMAAATIGIAWVAGRIYKVGILMAGKRPTLPEVWRWIREA